MKYYIPLGTSIRPYASKTKTAGMSRLTSIEVDLEASDLEETIQLVDLEHDELRDYYCLPLDPNPSPFDSYLVKVEDVILLP